MIAHSNGQDIRKIQQKAWRPPGITGFVCLGPGLWPCWWGERVVFLHASRHALDNGNDARGGIFLFKWKGCILSLHSTTLKSARGGGLGACLQSGGGRVFSTKQSKVQTVTSSENYLRASRLEPWLHRASLLGRLCDQVHRKGFHMAPRVWWSWMHSWVEPKDMK